MKYILIMFGLIAPIMQQASTSLTEKNHSAYETVGPIHREISQTSPVATEVIEQTGPSPGYKYKIRVQATVRNITNHQLVYVDPRQYYDVRVRGTGERAPETAAGCYVNFFSDCYRLSTPKGIPSTGLPKEIISPRGTIENVDFLDASYELAPGEYTVVGIYCSTQREGPECFKSNTITVTIPSGEK